MATNVVDVSYTQQSAQLFCGNFHRAGRRSCSGPGLRKRRGCRGVERDVAFNLLHGLMNVSVKHRHGTEFFEIGKRLRAIVSAPAPLGIYGPQRDMCEHHNGRAFGKVLHIFLHPLKLIIPQISQAAGFQIHHIVQPDEVDALMVKAVPAPPLGKLAKAIMELLAFVEKVMLAGNVKHFLGRESFSICSTVSNSSGLER